MEQFLGRLNFILFERYHFRGLEVFAIRLRLDMVLI